MGCPLSVGYGECCCCMVGQPLQQQARRPNRYPLSAHPHSLSLANLPPLPSPHHPLGPSAFCAMASLLCLSLEAISLDWLAGVCAMGEWVDWDRAGLNSWAVWWIVAPLAAMPALQLDLTALSPRTNGNRPLHYSREED